jgi:hypothetical protein
MKRPRHDVSDEQQSRSTERANVPPASGFAMIVDGHFKTQFVDADTARKAAQDLLAKYPMLQIQIFDASTRQRTLIK